MQNYDLEENEVVLYKGQVSQKKQKGLTELLLTNINFVLINKQKKLFSKEIVNVETYPIIELKYYNGVPQVIKKGNLIELYFLNEEIEFNFDSRNEARKFVNTTLNLLTNKTTFERTAEKVKETISVVDNTLGIDSVQLTENALKDGLLGKTTKVINKGVKIFKNFIKK